MPPPKKPELNFYGLRKLGYDESAFPLTGDYLRDQVMIEGICHRISHDPLEGGLGRFGHFKKWVDLTYNHPDRQSLKKFIWHRWADRAISAMCDNLEVGLAGSASCVAGHTRILDPHTGAQPTIQSLQEAGIRPWVQTLNGPVLAEVPFVKGNADLYRYTLSNGESFECTAEHRLLTPSGWRFASELRPHSQLFGYEPCPLQSILDTYLSDRQQDDHHYSETTEGSLSDCPVSDRLCGELLQLARGCDRDVLPSQADVQKYNLCVSGHSDAPSHESGHNHPCRLGDLSTDSDLHHTSPCQKPLSPLWNVEKPIHDEDSFSQSSPFVSGINPAHKVEAIFRHGHYRPNTGSISQLGGSVPPVGEARGSLHSQLNQFYQRLISCFSAPKTTVQSVCLSQVDASRASVVRCSSGLKVSLVQVVSIEKIGKSKFYDLHVPGEEHYFAEGGIHHNSGKTNPAGLWVVGQFLTDPTHVKAFVFTTTIKEAHDRIWKEITEFYQAVPGAPGRYVKSHNHILGMNYDGTAFGNSSGIYLYAGDRSNETNAVSSFIGSKVPKTGSPDEDPDSLLASEAYRDIRAMGFPHEFTRDLVLRLQEISSDRRGRIIIVIDEATGVSPKILEAYFTNLKLGNPNKVQIIVIGNPSSHFDTHGEFCEPAAGWGSINVNMESWTTKTGGICIHFDGEKNPRIVDGDNSLVWMPTEKDNKVIEDKYGRDSYEYMRMVRGFWAPEGSSNSIYSEAEFTETRALDKGTVWAQPPILLSGFDPSFTTGGDRAQAWFAKLGTDVMGTRILEYTEEVTIKADISNTRIPVPKQLALKWKAECEKRGVPPENASFDESGGGISFGAILKETWSSRVRGVSSNGKASDKTIPGEKDSRNQPVRGCDKFANRASELWCAMKPYLRSGQIRGITKELAKEICSRQKAAKKALANIEKIQIEPKAVYKDREKMSPDSSDGALILLDEARVRHGFKPDNTPGEIRNATGPSTGRTAWEELKARARKIHRRPGLR